MPLNRDLIDALVPPKAAAAALPACDGTHACVIDRDAARRGSAEYKETYDRLMASLSPEQRRLYRAFESNESAYWCDVQAEIVEELARHLPGLAPMIRGLFYHHIYEQRPDDRGECCED